MRTKRTLAMLLAWGLILTEAFSATGGTVRAAAPEPEMTAAEEQENLEAPADTDPDGEETPVPGVDEDISGEDSDPGAKETPGEAPDPAADEDTPEEPVLPEEATAEEAGDAGLFVETSDPPERTGDGNPLELTCDREWGGDDFIQVAHFVPAIVGYTAAQRPEAKEIHIKNTGEDVLTLESPAVTNAALSDKWEISGLKKTELAPGEETTFTARPKTGIITLWDGDAWQDAEFDLCVRTADGTAESHIPAIFCVGLIGTELGAELWVYGDIITYISRVYTANYLSRYYGENDVAALIGDTDIQLAPGDNLKIGGFKQFDDYCAVLSIGGTAATECGKIKAGTLQAGLLCAYAIDITDGVVWADELFVDGSNTDIDCYLNIPGGELHVAKSFRVDSDITLGWANEGFDPDTGEWKVEVFNTAKVYADCPIEFHAIFLYPGSELHVTPGDHEAAAALKCDWMNIYGNVYVRDAVNENRTTPSTAIFTGTMCLYDGRVIVEEPCPVSGSIGIRANETIETRESFGPTSSTIVAFSQAGPAIQCDCANDSYHFPAGCRLYAPARILAQSGDGRSGGFPAILSSLDNPKFFILNSNRIALPADGGIKAQDGMITVYDGDDQVASTVLIEPADQGTTEADKPSFAVSDSVLTLAGVEGEAAAPRTLTVTNNGNIPIRFDPEDIRPEKGADSLFEVTQTGSVLLPGEELTLTVKRKADVPGQRPLAGNAEPYTDTLLLTPHTLNGEPLTDTGTETGTPLTKSISLSLRLYPAFYLTPGGEDPEHPVSLGEAMEGQTLDPVTFTLKNNGTRTRKYDVRIVGYDPDDLRTTGEHPQLITDVDPVEGISLAPGAKKTFTVSSEALTGEGALTGRLEVYSGELTGTAPAEDPAAVVSEVYLSGKVLPATNNIWMKEIPDQYYSASALKPVPQVYAGAKKLTAQDYTVAYTNNTNIGTATVTVKGKGNYTGTDSKTFRILARSVSYAFTDTDEAVKQGVLAAHQTLTANGRKQQGKFVLKYRFEDGREVTLKENTDYTLDYGDGDYTAPGLYTITVNGKGNYTGSRTLKLALADPAAKILISKATVSAIPNQAYCGKSIVLRASGAVCEEGETFALNAQKKPFDFTVKMGNRLLRCGWDYRLTYTDNREIGTATVTISGTGDTYIGSVTKTFKITGTALSSAKLHGFLDGMLYTGNPVTQPCWFTDASGRELEEGVDYDVSYSVTPAVDPGTYEIVFTGRGGFTGSVKKTFKIVNDISYCKTRGMAASYAWTGSPIDPMDPAGAAPVLLVSGDKVLEAGTDYTYTISGNENPGTGTILVTAVAPYTGKAKITFKIVACPLDDTGRITILQPDGTTPWTADAAGWDDETWRKSGVKPEPVLIDGTRDCTLIPGTDYTLQWSNNTAAYTAADRAAGKKAPALTVTGKGKYAGKLTRNFLIEPAALSDMIVTATDVTKTSGSKGGFYRSTVVKVTDADGKVLTAGTDYWPVSGKENVLFEQLVERDSEPGQYDPVVLTLEDKPAAPAEIRLTIYGKGNYSGSNSNASYHIVKGSIASVPFKVKDQTYQYNGPVVLTTDDFDPVSSKIGGEQINLVYGTHYEIVPDSYQNNDKAGTAKVTVRGLGTAGLTGTKVLSFKIKQVGTDAGRIVVKTRDNAPWGKTYYPTYTYSKAAVKPEPVVVLTDGAGHDLVPLNNGTDYTLAWKNNTKSIEATGKTTDPTLTITFKGNYSGKFERCYTIEKAPFSENAFTLSVSQKLQPDVEADDSGKATRIGMIFKKSSMTATLTETATGRKLAGNEYTVSYSYETATVIRRLKNGQYEEVNIPAGGAGNPACSVQEGDIIPAGTTLCATVTAADNSNYMGSFSLTEASAVRILASADLKNVTVTPPAGLTYDFGRPIAEPDKEDFTVKAKFGTKTVTLDPDCYVVSAWPDPTDAGTVPVTIKGVPERGFAGSAVVNVKINPVSLTVLAKNTTAGKLPGLGAYVTSDLDGTRATLSDHMDTDTPVRFSYRKSGIKQDFTNGAVSVSDQQGTYTLERDTDFAVSYKNNTALCTFDTYDKAPANAPLFILTGRGNYCDSVAIPFSIVPCNIGGTADMTVTAADVVRQNKPGNFKLRDVTFKDQDGNKLTVNKDYCKADDKTHPFTYTNPGDTVTVIRGDAEAEVQQGEAFTDQDIVPYGTCVEVTVTGTGSYTGKRKGIYYILAAANLNTAKVTIPDQVYTGDPVTLGHDTNADGKIDDIVVTMTIGGNVVELTPGIDYTITGYENNINVGTAKVKIEGVREKGFVGSKICTFKIKARSMN